MAVDVAVQGRLELSRWREERQTDPHQLPAPTQALAAIRETGTQPEGREVGIILTKIIQHNIMSHLVILTIFCNNL